MLVLSRRIGETIFIGDDIVVTVVETRRDRVRLAIQAPRSTLIDREEIRKRRLEFNEPTSIEAGELPSTVLADGYVSVHGSQDGPERTEPNFDTSRIEELING